MQLVWTHLKRWGLSVVRQFRSAMPVLLGLAVALALLGIWWLGPHWQWRDERPLAELSMRMLASVLVLMVPLLLWSLSLRHRHAQLHRERERAAAVVADPGLAHVNEQEHFLGRQLQRLLEHLGGRRSLHRLPWYLMLGESNSGKSALVALGASGLPFTEHVAADESPVATQVRSIEWWVGSDAVLIDPPGQFVVRGPGATGALGEEMTAPGASGLPENLDARLWRNLLLWLGQHRSQRPLSGVVVVISLPDLLNKTIEKRSDLAQRLRARLRDLTLELGTQLPVYVVLSQLDLLVGFKELFDPLPESSREAATGFSFALDSSGNLDDWFRAFDQQLDTFVGGLEDRLIDAQPRVPTRAARQNLLSLQCSLSGMRALLVAFLSAVIRNDRFTTPTLLRGVYFSSVTQQGTLSNPYIKAIAKNYDLPIQPNAVKPKGPDFTYFTQSLFQKAIYPEAGLAGDNIKVARHKRQILFGGCAVASLATLLATAGWHHYFAANRDQATTVLTRSQEFGVNAVDTREDATGRNLLSSLDPLRSALAVYGDYRDAWPGVSDFGLYQGRVIGPTVDEAYLSLLSRRFLPAIAAGVIEQMDAAPAGSDEQLAALRVYRMIEDKANRQPDLVLDWMARRWQAAYPGEGQLQAGLRRHLAYALKYADAQLPEHAERVAAVQQQLRQIPMAQRVYLSLKQHAAEQLHKDLDLRNEIGPAFDVVYYSAQPQLMNLPALLTAKGYQEYFEPRSDDLARLAIVDQWVLGERRQLDYSAQDLKTLADRLRGLYSADYIDSWRGVLNRLTVTDFSDLTHAVVVLEEVTGPTAPLRRLLETVGDNAHLSALPAALELTGLAPPPAAQQVAIEREFAGLVKLLEEKGDKPAYYEQVLGTINGLYEYAKAVQDSPDRGKAALAAVMARFALNSPDPISALQRTAAGLPEPLNLQVRKLADQTAQVLMVEALRELEKRWHSDVYGFYQQRLAGRYPLSASGSDASLEDFEAFFGPRGRLQQFQDQYLNLFVRDNLDALKSVNHGGYLVRGEVLDQLQAAERIRETFFDNRGALGVQFSLEPLGLSGNKRSSVLALDGQLIPYSHGPSNRIGLIWPNTLTAGPGSKLALVHAAGNTSSLGFQGPWSLFRLLSSAQLYGHTATSVDLSFRIGDGVMRYRVSAEKALNPFTLRPFKGFELPRTLLQRGELQATR
ncbi:type VI secretion system membrane subunit TssM [Pseudomonas sp. HR96]|uniref:type VI secretion system membrane subunit TssM n=1 Tax=Pseudomonas sp. HR96 TaxID=1027966 RepID=UPI002A758923|nr:type VI secretion system membrane subunit TssM [Pseudomonas sp. HR96]WPO98780.1 type VI secretion system membrane subunit TssM [Pseudomonas sp. HR96]